MAVETMILFLLFAIPPAKHITYTEQSLYHGSGCVHVNPVMRSIGPEVYVSIT